MQQRRGRIKLRYLAVIAVFVWAIYFYWHVQHAQLSALSLKEAQLKAELATSQKQHANLVNLTHEFQNAAYIQRYAAEHFNLILPNQVAFTVQH